MPCIRHGTVTAAFWGMTNVMLIMLALVAAGVVIELLTAVTAPLGYEDEKGFHHGRESVPVAQERKDRNQG